MSRKTDLQEQCFNMLTRSWSDGGIASNNEYNQFLCDTAPEMLKYMSVEGLKWLKEQMDETYKNTVESDKW